MKHVAVRLGAALFSASVLDWFGFSAHNRGPTSGNINSRRHGYVLQLNRLPELCSTIEGHAWS